ncbi:MAG: type III-A CRISPR-associated protein Cas10/Csm1 [Leptolyngbyaceae cyanobacterium bins.59]|nr:type III-A CRISPR-associated protein Cas10/Csm1 [Leptolyngbyaceae cyanobacterium bins.59]
MTKLNPSHQNALAVVQFGIQALSTWAEAKLTFKVDTQSSAIKHGKERLSWSDEAKPDVLQLLFDRVCLSDQGQSTNHYWIPVEIADGTPPVPYPITQVPDTEHIEQLKTSIRDEIAALSERDWQNLSLLMLILEKFGSFISFGAADIALIDLVRSMAAVAAALADTPDASQLALIAGDLSGIQDFIYTIASDGALKSLRARSFYLELVTEEIVQQILIELQLPRPNVIYAGGGNLYILASATKETYDAIEQIQQQFNQWFLEVFQGKVFLALSHHAFPTEDVGSAKLSEAWQAVIKKQNQQKLRKFDREILSSQLLTERESYETCKVCHRDDLEPAKLKPLNPGEPDSPSACPQCRQMFQLGAHLPRTEVIVRSLEKLSTGYCLPFYLSSGTVYYHLFKQDEANSKIIASDKNSVLYINNWQIESYRVGHATPLLLGNYGQRGADPNLFMSAAEMATAAQGIDRVGYLRMDVDRLGQIFANGLGKHQNLPRLAGLSRQMSYFFKVYLNSLASDRQTNFFNSQQQFKHLQHDNRHQLERPDLLFIYAGGDDLFISGAWNQVTDFAFDIYQAFRCYTGHHPVITLSGGISIAAEKYPLYQAASDSGDAESNAKGNGKDSLGLFGEVFKWHEWLGQFELDSLNADDRTYLQSEPKPELFGVLPFVQALNTQLDVNQSRGFIRNLLLTAQLQSELIKQAKEKQSTSIQDIRYYLHLPKVAYTLARLPQNVRDHPNFLPVRLALKNPRNAPYFRAIATWLELLNRNPSNS